MFNIKNSVRKLARYVLRNEIDTRNYESTDELLDLLNIWHDKSYRVVNGLNHKIFVDSIMFYRYAYERLIYINANGMSLESDEYTLTKGLSIEKIEDKKLIKINGLLDKFYSHAGLYNSLAFYNRARGVLNFEGKKSNDSEVIEKKKEVIFKNDFMSQIYNKLKNKFEEDQLFLSLIEIIFLQMEKFKFDEISSIGEGKSLDDIFNMDTKKLSGITLMQHTLNLIDIYLSNEEIRQDLIRLYEVDDKELILAAAFHDFGKSMNVSKSVNCDLEEDRHSYISRKYIDEVLLNLIDGETKKFRTWPIYLRSLRRISLAVFIHDNPLLINVPFAQALKRLDQETRKKELS